MFSIFKGNSQQSTPYALNPSTEAWIAGTAIPLAGVGFFLDKKLEPLTQEQINLLDANDVNRFDRFTTNNFSLTIVKRSDWTMLSTIGLGLASTFIVPALHKTTSSYVNQVGTLGVMWFETNLVNYAITEIVKTSFKRNRPFLYGGAAPDDLMFGKDARKSFFSGHASFTAANSFFAASLVTSYQKGNKWNPVIWGAAALPPLLVSFQRVRAGKHFPTDVITGYIIGAVCGILIPKLHEVSIPRQGDIKLGASISPDGMSIPIVNFKMVL